MPHTADIALRVRGAHLADLLQTAARGLAAAISGVEEIAVCRVPSGQPRLMESEGAPDEEGLLVNFLNELIFQQEVRQELYADCEVLACSLEEGVRARCYSDTGLPAVHAVKAATYYDLRIVCGAQGLEATVVFDV